VHTLHYLEREPAPGSQAEGAPVPTLVLIPGLTMEAHVFVSLIEKLRIPEYRVIVVELPAHGANRCVQPHSLTAALRTPLLCRRDRSALARCGQHWPDVKQARAMLQCAAIYGDARQQR
jgi:pimeloyl-ACP methyl ester carboxylesterase